MNAQSEKLWMLLKKAGQTQTQMAKAVGVSRETVRTWFSGEKAPHPRNLAAIAAFFGVPVDDLTGHEHDVGKAGNEFQRPLAAQSRELQLEREKLELERRLIEADRKLVEAERAKSFIEAAIPQFREIAEIMYLNRLRAGEPAGLLRMRAAAIDKTLGVALHASVYTEGFELALAAFEAEQKGQKQSSPKPADSTPHASAYSGNTSGNGSAQAIGPGASANVPKKK